MRALSILFLCAVCFVNIAWSPAEPKAAELIKEGYTAWRAGNRSAAISHYTNALALDPKQVDALNTLGVIYEEVGDKTKAAEAYRRAIRLDSRFLPAYSNLGYLFWNQGDFQSASYYFQKRVQYGHPQDPWTIKAKKALESIEKNKGRHSDVSDALNQIGQ
jgi:Flp pilus assembly protein TadD